MDAKIWIVSNKITQWYVGDEKKLNLNEVEIVEFDKKVELANKIGIKYILSTLNEAKCSMFNNYLRALDAEERSLHHLANISKQEEKRNEDYISLMMYNLNILKEVLPN